MDCHQENNKLRHNQPYIGCRADDLRAEWPTRGSTLGSGPRWSSSTRPSGGPRRCTLRWESRRIRRAHRASERKAAMDICGLQMPQFYGNARSAYHVPDFAVVFRLVVICNADPLSIPVKPKILF